MRHWFYRASYGKLRYVSTPVLRYIRMPKPFHSYGIGRGYGWRTHTAMMRDLLRVADRQIDFSGYDLVNVLVTPNAGPPAEQAVLSVTWTGASAVTTDDGTALDRVSLVYGHDQSGARVLSHENGHAFGLPDLYSVEDFGHTDTLAGQWDSMSLDWGLQGDLFAWHKWRLGWLDDWQVVCVRDPGARSVHLTPVEVPGGRKAAVIPLGRTRAYVVEARAARGNDSEACREGVLVYQVRTDVDSGRGPVTVEDAHPRTTACEYSSATFNALNDAPFSSGDASPTAPAASPSRSSAATRTTRAGPCGSPPRARCGTAPRAGVRDARPPAEEVAGHDERRPPDGRAPRSTALP